MQLYSNQTFLVLAQTCLFFCFFFSTHLDKIKQEMLSNALTHHLLALLCGTAAPTAFEVRLFSNPSPFVKLDFHLGVRSFHLAIHEHAAVVICSQLSGGFQLSFFLCEAFIYFLSCFFSLLWE